MEWVEMTTSKAIADFPSDLKTEYEAWLVANPDKSDRLGEIVASTIAEFRDALKSAPTNTVHEDESYLPLAAIRHCESIVYASLCMEMGIEMSSSGNSARTSADVFLRQLPYGRWVAETEESGQGMPSFKIPERMSYTSRILLVVFLSLLPLRVFAGWIKPQGAIQDIRIEPTYAPATYSNTTTTLFGHLQGIDQQFASWGDPNDYMVATTGTLWVSSISRQTATVTSGYDATNPPLTITGADSFTYFWPDPYGTYSHYAGSVLIRGGSNSAALGGGYAPVTIYNVDIQSGTASLAAVSSEFAEFDALQIGTALTYVVEAISYGPGLGESGTNGPLVLKGSDGLYGGSFNHYAGPVHISGGTNPSTLGGGLAPVIIDNLQPSSGSAYNLTNFPEYLATTGYVSNAIPSMLVFSNLFLSTHNPNVQTTAALRVNGELNSSGYASLDFGSGTLVGGTIRSSSQGIHLSTPRNTMGYPVDSKIYFCGGSADGGSIRTNFSIYHSAAQFFTDVNVPGYQIGASTITAQTAYVHSGMFEEVQVFGADVITTDSSELGVLQDHVSDTDNPHAVTVEQLGLAGISTGVITGTVYGHTFNNGVGTFEVGASSTYMYFDSDGPTEGGRWLDRQNFYYGINVGNLSGSPSSGVRSEGDVVTYGDLSAIGGTLTLGTNAITATATNFVFTIGTNSWSLGL